MKHKIRAKHYLRYSDDFIILSDSKDYLLEMIAYIQLFLNEKLALSLHKNKVIIRKVSSGIDFVGYIVFPKYIKIRTKTLRRIKRKVFSDEISEQSFSSYLGVLSHSCSHQISGELRNYRYLKAL